MKELISSEQLVVLAGQNTFEKGQETYLAASIKVTDQSDQSVKAEIDGYVTQLRFRDQLVDGSCSCPESDNFDFCHHCVALCLHLNDLYAQRLALSKGPERSQILAYLLSLDALSLSKITLDLIESDTEIKKQFSLRAMLHQSPVDYKQLKAHLTQITKKPDNAFSQRLLQSHFRPIKTFIEEFRQAEVIHPDMPAWSILLHLIKRLNLLFSKLDLSARESFDFATLSDLCLRISTAAAPQPDALFQYLYELWSIDTLGLIDEAIEGQNPTEWERYLLARWREGSTNDKIKNKLARACYGAQTLQLGDRDKLALLACFAKHPEELRAWVALCLANDDREQGIAICERLIKLSSEERDMVELAKLLSLSPPDETKLLALFKQNPVALFDIVQECIETHHTDILKAQVGAFLQQQYQRYPDLLGQHLLRHQSLEAFISLAQSGLLSLDTLKSALRHSVSKTQRLLLTNIFVEQCLAKNMNKYIVDAADQVKELKAQLQDDSAAFLNYYEHLLERHRSHSSFVQRLKQALAAS